MSEAAPLYERDPEAWQAHLAEGNASQPRKRVGADALVRDQRGRVLLVDPKYKPDWDIPGGMAEANEPPTLTVRRELREELGLEIVVGRLLCVDWVSPHGPWDDSLMFIFDGGILSDRRIASLQLRDGELGNYQFADRTTAQALLRDYVWNRLGAALEALNSGGVAYLEDGQVTSTSAGDSRRD